MDKPAIREESGGMEDSIFISVLEYGEKAGLKGITRQDLKNWATEKGFVSGHNDDIKVGFLMNLFKECFEKVTPLNVGTPKWNLKTEYYFRLIEYRELQESRLSARSANRNAIWAIGLSIFAIIVSGILAFNQLTTSVGMNKSDLQAFIISNTRENRQREVKLDSLQMAQILSAMGYRQAKPENERKSSQNKDQGKEVSHHQLINQYFEDESGAILQE